jgi:hypothetical protein
MTETQDTAAPAATPAPAAPAPVAASPQQVAITPERNAAANKVASVFNSLDMFLHTLAHDGEQGGKVYSKYLENAIMRLSEAANHTIKHVLMFGEPVRKPIVKEPPAPSSNDDNAKEAATPAPIGEVDPPQSVEAVAPAPAVVEAATETLKS